MLSLGQWVEVGAVAVLVAAAAFFAASEAALIAVSRIRARAMVERGLKRAKAVADLLEDRNRFLTSVLIGNTIVLLAADSLSTYLFIKLGIPDGALISTILLTAIILLLGEIIPKTVAVSDSERWALRLAPMMHYVAWILTPVANVFLFLTRLLVRPFGIKTTLVNVGAEQRVIEEQEREMIHSVIEFGDTIVREVMTPRPEMVAVSIDDSAR